MRQLLRILVFFILFFSCKKEWDIKNPDGEKIKVIGHAGSGFRSLYNPVPENSFLSIKKAVELYGAVGIEVDVQMTNDGILFLYHDEQLSTRTNFTGCIYNYNSMDLQKCYYNNSNEKLMTLEQCLQYCSSFQKKPLIFIDSRLSVICNKNISYNHFISDYAENIYQLVNKYQAMDWVYVESSDTSFLRLLNNKSQFLKLMIEGNISSNINLAIAMKLHGIVVSNRNVNKKEVELAHSNNLQVIFFEALNKNQMIDAIKKSPDMIQTDNILLLKQLLNE